MPEVMDFVTGNIFFERMGLWTEKLLNRRGGYLIWVLVKLKVCVTYFLGLSEN